MEWIVSLALGVAALASRTQTHIYVETCRAFLPNANPEVLARKYRTSMTVGGWALVALGIALGLVRLWKFAL